MFTLSFNKTLSKNYSLAVEKAKELGAIIESGKVTIEMQDYELLYAYERLYPLLGIIHKWKGTTAEYNGIKVHPFRFIFSLWYSFNDCIEKKHGTWDKRHCWKDRDHEEWGCKRLNPFHRNIHGNGEYKKSNQFWYNFGEFDEGKNWIINKKLIMQLLIQHSEKSCLKLCPFFDIERAKEIVDKLPDKIILDGVNFRPYFQDGQMVNIRHNSEFLDIEKQVISYSKGCYQDILLMNQMYLADRGSKGFEIGQN